MSNRLISMRDTHNLSFNRTSFHSSIQACIRKPIKYILKSLLIELNNAKSSAKQQAPNITLPNVTPLLEELPLFILSMYIMNRRGERTQPCCSPTLTLKGFYFHAIDTNTDFRLFVQQFDSS